MPTRLDDVDCAKLPRFRDGPDLSSVPLLPHHFAAFKGARLEDIDVPDSFFDLRSHSRISFAQLAGMLAPAAMYAVKRAAVSAVVTPWEAASIMTAVHPRDHVDEPLFTEINPFIDSSSTRSGAARQRADHDTGMYYPSDWTAQPPRTGDAAIGKQRPMRVDAQGYLPAKWPIRLIDCDQMDNLRAIARQQGIGCLFRAVHLRWLSLVVGDAVQTAFLGLSSVLPLSGRFAALHSGDAVMLAAEGVRSIAAAPIERALILRILGDDRQSVWRRPTSWLFTAAASLADPLARYFIPRLLDRFVAPLSSLVARLVPPTLALAFNLVADHLVHCLPLLVTVPLHNISTRFHASVHANDYSTTDSSPASFYIPTKSYSGCWDCLARLVTEEGISALYCGWRWHVSAVALRIAVKHARTYVYESSSAYSTPLPAIDDDDMLLL